MSINTITIDGNVGRDVEFKHTSNDNLKASFSIGHTVYGANGSKETDWFNVQAFGKTAETIRKLSIGKGSYVCIAGRMRVQAYEKDGEKKTYPVIILNAISVKGNKRQDENEDVPF
jgi:single-strand DNA-binding protein